jgi:hypothetical protein
MFGGGVTSRKLYINAQYWFDFKGTWSRGNSPQKGFQKTRYDTERKKTQHEVGLQSPRMEEFG